MRAGVVFLVAAAIAAAIAASPASAGAKPPVTEHAVTSAPGAASSYWTKSRLRDADPLSVAIRPSGAPKLSGSATPADTATGSTPDPLAGPSFTSNDIADPTTPQYRVNGKVFFHDPSDGHNYQCSGTAVHSPNGSVVLTAGHCVYYGSFSTNFVFIPGYHNAATPFGIWAASSLSAPGGWTSSFDCSNLPDNCPNFDFDLGAAVVSHNSGGQSLEDVVGGAGIAFNQPRSATYDAYGYPAEPPFDGDTLHTCHSPLGGSDTADPRGGPAPIWIGCDMNGGSSGGGWLVDGVRESHNDYSYTGGPPNRMYGPYYGDDAESLYDAASGTTPPPGPASRPAPPDTKLTGHPKRRSHKRRAKFEFATGDGSPAQFRCRLDSDPWALCSSGHVTYRQLSVGKHDFEVAATTDASGDDASPATFAFRVKRAH